MLYGVQTLVCSGRASTIAHIYPSVFQAIVGGAMRNVWRGAFMGYWGVVMQDLACELPRKSIPRTLVNRARGNHDVAAPAFRVFESRIARCATPGVRASSPVSAEMLRRSH